MATSASRIGSTALVIAALTFPVVVASAGKDVAAARLEYQRGYLQLQRGNYEQALRHYTRSYELVSRPRTLFNIAVCHEKLQQLREALQHYEDFVQLAEQRDRQYVKEAREKIAALRKRLEGTVLVTSQPSGARVFVDASDNATGKTPLVLRLREGPHRLRLTLPGAEAVERHVEVRGQQRTTAKFTLTQTAAVEIETEPRDATIRRRGSHEVATGSLRGKVALGTHWFEISREGYRSETVKINVKPGRIHERVVRLQPLRGKALLLIRSSNPGARVSIDGIIVGTTSLATSTAGERARLRHAIPAGQHLVMVEGDGTAWSQQLHLSPGETLSVQVQFRGRSAVRTWGLAALGVAGVIAGGVVGARALGDVRSDMVDDHKRGKDRAWLADVLLLGGAAALLSSWHFARQSTSSATLRRDYAEQ